MRVGLTGASGLLGSATHLALSSVGHSVLAVGRRPVGTDFALCDLTKATEVRDLLRDVDVVVHAAGKKDASDDVEENVSMAEALAEASAATATPIVNFSSLAVYGRSKQLVVDEAAPCLPVTNYGASKLAGEHAFDSVGASACHLRIGNVYSSQLLADLIESPLRRVLKAGETTNLVFPSDVADATVFVIEAKSRLGVANVVRPVIGQESFAELLVRAAPGLRPLPRTPTLIPHIVRLLRGVPSIRADIRYPPRALLAAGFEFSDISTVAPASWIARG